MAASYDILRSTSSSITIRITLDSSNPYYNIFWRPTSSSSSTSTGLIKYTGTYKDYEITGLTSGTAYTVNVAYGPTSLTADSTFLGSTDLTYESVVLTYNNNGGSGGPGSSTHYGWVKNYGNIQVTIPATKPTKSGYTFLGWATSSSATSPSYYSGTTYNNWYASTGTGDNTTLYAVWSEDETGYVYIYSNGWKKAIPYVYSGGWKQAKAYVYSSGWKSTS